jgi:radical SAM superfamily enzyme YgiQ (UPF0313 family)
MKVKLILPALSEAKTPHYRQIKYSLFAPLGMAQLAAYVDSEDDVDLQDENVERLNLDDEPDLVAIHVRITSAYRAYEIADHYRAKGAYVCLGGLHVTSVPEEAAPHADSIFLGPGEDTWPMFLKDFRAGRPRAVYQSTNRNLEGVPVPRRDLIKKQLYLVPSTIVVSRGCPHLCGFCSNESFFAKGKHFYTRRVDEALAEIESLPGRNLYFLDDHLFGNAKFVEELFEGMRGMGRLWQTATTVRAALKPGLLEKAASCGLRSLVMGFETLNAGNLRDVGKVQNLNLDYNAAIRRMHDNGVLINGTFVFGFDKDNEDVFDRTVDWALEQGVETATFHILTPYPGTTLYRRMKQANRILTTNWRLYDTCHAVFKPNRITPKALEEGYHRAYSRFYKWGSILKGAWIKPTAVDSLRHLLYTAGWHKFVTSWNLVIKCGGLPMMRPLLKLLLSGFGRYGVDFENGDIK